MNKVTKKPFVLVDGSSYLFRAYYALPPLTNSQHEPTSAIYGVINMLKKLIADYQPENMAVIFDPKGKTFRKDLFPAYKANRTAMPDELQVQIKPLFEIIQALGIPLIIKEGYEADDVIATLAAAAENEAMDVLISTGDKDLAQIVNKNITLINTMTDKKLDPKGVLEKWGITPEQMIDYLTLVGDTSDNLPGIPKVGPKTAVKWLTTYGSLDNLIKHADEITGKVGENLREHIDEIPLMRRLVTVVSDITLEQKPSDLVRREYDREKLINLFTRFEFKSWLAELLTGQSAKTEKIKKYETLLDKKSFDKWMKKLNAATAFALDTETTHLEATRASLVGVSFSVTPGEAAYVPLKHDYLGAPLQLDKAYVLSEIQRLLNDSNKTLIGQNIKYDLEVLAREGVEMHNKLRDTLLESYIINSANSRHDLNTLALKYLGKKAITFEEIAGKGAKQMTFNQIAIDTASEYAAEDADFTLQIDQKLMPVIDGEKNYKKVFEQIEMPLMPILAKMELKGVLIDVNKLTHQSKYLAKRIRELEAEAYQLAGKKFNLSSSKQLQIVLYEELKLPILKKTPGGQASTAEFVLQDLALNYPFPKIILEYRSLSKLKSTYTDRLPEEVHLDTGRVHTSYNQAVTSTGRLSSNNPNLQNIPIRTEEGRKIRQAFIAPKGYQIISADYSQIELRIIAHISKDPNLISAFERSIDIHRATAAEVFSVKLDQVTPEQRRRAKTINFGLLYGMSAFGLSRQLGVERDLAQQYMDVYFERYPNVYDYMKKIREVAADQGYVETLFGRRVYLPDIRSTNLQRRRAAERAAINAPMQGTAADIIKIAMINMDRSLKKLKLHAHMIMQVHDELVFEVAKPDVDHALAHIQSAMESAVILSVPLSIHIGIGDNWDEAH